MWTQSRRSRVVTGLALLVAGLAFLVAGWALPVTGAGPVVQAQLTNAERGALLQEIKSAMDGGVRWLANHQNPDGGYGPYGDDFRIKNASDVGITAYALYAFSRHPRGYSEVDGPFISKAVDFILARQKPDGAFYDRRDPTLLNYKTSVVILALSHLDPTRYSKAILRAREFVKNQQFSESGGYDRSRHLSYGGIGYGGGLRPDNSNSQFALEALSRSGLSASDELWARAQVYLRRSLNSKGVDSLLKEARIGTTGDGGARYAPNDTRGPVETLDDGTRVFSSYGSMSYAALKSFLYARVDRRDPAVAGLFRWVSRNFTVRENPGMATKNSPRAGRQGLFYYYQTMAKALHLFGEPVVTDAAGVEHHWASELTTHLLAIQKDDGHWKNESDRWWENLPTLDTSYSLVALAECSAQLKAEMRLPGGLTTGPKKVGTRAPEKAK